MDRVHHRGRIFTFLEVFLLVFLRLVLLSLFWLSSFTSPTATANVLTSLCSSSSVCLFVFFTSTSRGWNRQDICFLVCNRWPFSQNSPLLILTQIDKNIFPSSCQPSSSCPGYRQHSSTPSRLPTFPTENIILEWSGLSYSLHYALHKLLSSLVLQGFAHFAGLIQI